MALGEAVRGRQVRAFARVPLAPGAVTPSPSGPNLQRSDEVRAAIQRARETVGGLRVTLVLPDGIARVALVEVPAEVEPQDYVRFRFATSLPWPAAEAIVEVLPAGGGRVVGAAVRRATVVQYEQVATASGLEVESVHLAPLLALERLIRSGARDAVHVVLSDVALCLAVFHGGALVALHNRRRDPSPVEASWLRAEAARAGSVAGNGAGSPLVVSGAGALRLRRDAGVEGAGRGLEGPREWPEAVEAAWLGALLS